MPLLSDFSCLPLPLFLSSASRSDSPEISEVTGCFSHSACKKQLLSCIMLHEHLSLVPSPACERLSLLRIPLWYYTPAFFFLPLSHPVCIAGTAQSPGYDVGSQHFFRPLIHSHQHVMLTFLQKVPYRVHITSLWSDLHIRRWPQELFPLRIQTLRITTSASQWQKQTLFSPRLWRLQLPQRITLQLW